MEHKDIEIILLWNSFKFRKKDGDLNINILLDNVSLYKDNGR